MELMRTLKIVLTFAKNDKKSLTFEQRKKVTGWTFFLCKYGFVPTTDEDKRLAEEEMDGVLRRMSSVLMQLPAYVLEGVEDLAPVCLGYVDKETKAKMQEFFDSQGWVGEIL